MNSRQGLSFHLQYETAHNGRGVRTLLGLAVAFAVALPSLGQTAPAAGPQPDSGLLSTGTAAPTFTLKTVEGKALKLSELTAKGPVLLVFFFLRSGFCQAQLTHLQKSYEQYHNQGLEIVCIHANAGEGDDEILGYWKANQLTVPVVRDEREGAVARVYRTTNFPTTYLVGKDGRVISAWAGFSSVAGPTRLKDELAKLSLK